MKPIRVLIVDDVPQVRRELRALLPLLDDIEIVGEAENGQSAIELATALQPDVILMDVEMPIVDGITATRSIKRQHLPCRIIVLSIHDEEAVRTQARSAGADDFVDKGAPLTTLLQAIQADVTIQPSCPSAFVGHPGRPCAPGFPPKARGNDGTATAG